LVRRFGLVFLLVVLALAQDRPTFRVKVDLVVLSFTVTDNKGHYINGLQPKDVRVTEDGIEQKLSPFAEGNKPPLEIQADGSARPMQISEQGKLEVATSDLAGTNVFVLFDTSNYMYRGFVFAQDAITDFIRSMNNASRIAFYSYCRDLSRAMRLTSDHFQIVNAVRSTVAGDDAALYNSLLLTVKDAAPLKGRKAIVVFSNGPDNASSVPPEDVAELAQSSGTIIYIISTRQAEEDPASAAAFERMSKVSGGKAYFAKNWLDEKKAFSSIREDLVHLYTVSYYPQANPNRGWRSIKVRLVGKDMQKFHLRTRDGYRLAAQR